MTISREDFLARVVERGEYRGDAEADHAARVVLALLGEHLVGGERAELAESLPETYASLLRDARPTGEALTAERFVEAVVGWIDGATPATAQWDIGAVLSTLADLAPDELIGRVLDQLPDGYDLLFGHPLPA
ncbi:DUF2267 domain-containing protein [Streptomyces kaniharaensis]|uniref:DUF2267 domain-containing protein n=1 Tax=Streptomyces kaniharaensis TaxID=212423 RepID=A0A6N7KN82_9ACTN|nr:DUF2267 domain-containing protein [Streptomyces kaniharaensis]MQS11093.1 DUF2267 domain-containing protein [Streptomyces kaniharaensis]